MSESLLKTGDLNDHLRLLHFRAATDSRGLLTEFDYAALPFPVQRAFTITGVPRSTTRGGHAHKKCEHVLVCLQGQVTVEAAFQSQRTTVVLNDPSVGLFIGAGVWAAQTYDQDDTVLLTFASLPYDQDSYIQSGGPGHDIVR
jgi:dTDP-4-dehydrorhamnose 3,5-epimerase-like enzyme